MNVNHAKRSGLKRGQKDPENDITAKFKCKLTAKRTIDLSGHRHQAVICQFHFSSPFKTAFLSSEKKGELSVQNFGPMLRGRAGSCSPIPGPRSAVETTLSKGLPAPHRPSVRTNVRPRSPHPWVY